MPLGAADRLGPDGGDVPADTLQRGGRGVEHALAPFGHRARDTALVIAVPGHRLGDVHGEQAAALPQPQPAAEQEIGERRVPAVVTAPPRPVRLPGGVIAEQAHLKPEPVGPRRYPLHIRTAHIPRRLVGGHHRAAVPQPHRVYQHRAARDMAFLFGPLIQQPQRGQLPLPLATADPPARLLATPPPRFPVQQVVPVRLVPVFPALPQEGEEQPVVLGVRFPCPLREPREPRRGEKAGQHRVDPVLRVDQDRVARGDARIRLALVQVSPSGKHRHPVARHRPARHRPVQQPLPVRPRIQVHRSNLPAAARDCRDGHAVLMATTAGCPCGMHKRWRQYLEFFDLGYPLERLLICWPLADAGCAQRRAPAHVTHHGV